MPDLPEPKKLSEYTGDELEQFAFENEIDITAVLEYIKLEEEENDQD